MLPPIKRAKIMWRLVMRKDNFVQKAVYVLVTHWRYSFTKVFDSGKKLFWLKYFFNSFINFFSSFKRHVIYVYMSCVVGYTLKSSEICFTIASFWRGWKHVFPSVSKQWQSATGRRYNTWFCSDARQRHTTRPEGQPILASPLK